MEELVGWWEGGGGAVEKSFVKSGDGKGRDGRDHGAGGRGTGGELQEPWQCFNSCYVMDGGRRDAGK